MFEHVCMLQIIILDHKITQKDHTLTYVKLVTSHRLQWLFKICKIPGNRETVI